MSTAEVTPMRPAKGLDVLRQPFDQKVVGKLPRVTDKAGAKSKCNECGGFLPRHVHLDYVGHAEVTDRLLSADPEWNWEPLAWTEDGLPKFTKGASGELELWIRLTVCGVTRLGVGSVAGNAFDAEKQLIGDALRNAAMRFGVALDLWAKEELESQLPVEDEKPKRSKPAPPRSPDDEGLRSAVAHTRPPSSQRVEDTRPPDELEPPSTGTRKRKPPTAAAEKPAPNARPADEKLREDVRELIDGLKAAGSEWHERALGAWKGAGLPPRGVDVLSQADAERAFEVLAPVFVECEKAQAQPTLDGGAA